MRLLPALMFMGGWFVLPAQVAPYYKELHYRLFPTVNDTRERRWLSQLRMTMENLRKVEWNDRFFREVASLYLEAPDELPILLDSLSYETGVKGLLLHRLWQSLNDPEASGDNLLTNWKALLPQAQADTTLEGALAADLILLGEAAIEIWLPTGIRSVPLIEATWMGYLRAVWAAYRFMGFKDSPEPWPQKLRIITAIGLLEYYAYAEAANRYRSWKRGYWN